MVLFSASCFSAFCPPPAEGGQFKFFQKGAQVKTYKHLYPQVCDFENIYRAYRKARKGKRGRPQTAQFERVQDDELLNLQEELQTRTYKPGAYHNFYIHDPKQRLISAAPFRDRVVHHALCRVIEPIWEQRFIHDTYANRIGKGTHRALDRTQYFAQRYKYFLQCDVKQFFPSIDHTLLRAEFARLIHDEAVLWLCDQILHSGVGVLTEEYEMVYFEGDDLFATNRPRGLPIGNLTSQFWANVYLNGFDHFVKRELHCAAYIRYVDDFLLFSNDKELLKEWRGRIIHKLAELRLTLHEECAQIFPARTGIPFLGFRVHPNHRLLKTRKAIHFRRKLKQLVNAHTSRWLAFSKLHQTIQSWTHYVSYGNTWGLRRSVLRGVVL
jgi:retron-type reverse transcriptase